MTKKEKNRIIAEAMGHCWHDWVWMECDREWNLYTCSKCKEKLHLHTNPFETALLPYTDYHKPAQLMQLVWDCIKKQHAGELFDEDFEYPIDTWLLGCLLPDADGNIQFIDDLVEYFKSREGK